MAAQATAKRANRYAAILFGTDWLQYSSRAEENVLATSHHKFQLDEFAVLNLATNQLIYNTLH